jgi:hypothetical protein
MHGSGVKSVQGFGGKAQRKRDHLEVWGVDGRMGSKWTLGILDGVGLQISLKMKIFFKTEPRYPQRPVKYIVSCI